jgi:acetolactate synthase-1/2/3 large subunit
VAAPPAWLGSGTSLPRAIVGVLEEVGIDTVFGNPGGNVLPIFDALYDHQAMIRTVLVRDESMATVMAQVYGRLTGKPGVVIAQAAFLAARLGVLEAQLSCTPMVLITESTDGGLLSHHAYQAGTGDYGAWDARQTFAGHVKAVFVPRTPHQAVQDLQLALKHAVSGQPGPTVLLLHSEVVKGQVSAETTPRIYATAAYLPVPTAAAPVQLRLAADLLRLAVRPIILAGGGVRTAGAAQQLRELAELLEIPVATTAAGKSAMPETHPLAMGPIGRNGTPAANVLLAGSDVVLVVGSRLAPADTANESPRLLDPAHQRIIQIDVEPRNTSWTFPSEVALIGDARVVLSQLRESLEGTTTHDGLRRGRAARDEYGLFDSLEATSERKPIMPHRLVHDLQLAATGDVIIAADAGDSRVFMSRYFQTTGNQVFLQPVGVFGMGYAMPAAMAARLCHPDRAAVAVIGDGAFSIASSCLFTAVEERIAVCVVVVNNSAFGMTRNGQGNQPIASELGQFDYAAIASAASWHAVRVEDPAALRPALERALTIPGPALVDVVTDWRVTSEPSLTVAPVFERR